MRPAPSFVVRLTLLAVVVTSVVVAPAAAGGPHMDGRVAQADGIDDATTPTLDTPALLTAIDQWRTGDTGVGRLLMTIEYWRSDATAPDVADDVAAGEISPADRDWLFAISALEPLGEELPTVTVGTADGFDRPDAVVEAAVAYWHAERIQTHTERAIAFEFTGSADADVVIELDSAFTTCGDQTRETGFEGCAPRISPENPIADATVRIHADLNDVSMEHTIEHELGHVLGLGHDDTPQWLMSNGDDEGDVVDWTAREHPWYHGDDLRVTVVMEEDQAAVETAVKDAIEFYNNQRAYLPPETELAYVDEPFRADIVFRDTVPPFVRTVPEDAPSYGYRFGQDWDADPSLERLEVTYVYLWDVEGIDRTAGYWIGIFAGNEVGELPAEYR